VTQITREAWTAIFRDDLIQFAPPRLRDCRWRVGVGGCLTAVSAENDSCGLACGMDRILDNCTCALASAAKREDFYLQMKAKMLDRLAKRKES